MNVLIYPSGSVEMSGSKCGQQQIDNVALAICSLLQALNEAGFVGWISGAQSDNPMKSWMVLRLSNLDRDRCPWFWSNRNFG